MDNICPHCGSKKIIPDLPLSVEVSTAGGAGWGSADVRIEGAPQNWVFKDPTLGGLTARICGECGHTELHANNHRRLYEKYEKTRQS